METLSRIGRPVVNETYADLLDGYGVQACRRASGRRSRNKGAVEQGVLHVERRVLAPLRKHAMNLFRGELLFDFGRCSINLGWAQVDTTEDASYFGIGTHPDQRIILQYAEGDIIEDCYGNDDASYAQALCGLQAGNLERSYWRAERSRIQSSRHHFRAWISRTSCTHSPKTAATDPPPPKPGPFGNRPDPNSGTLRP